MFDLNRFSKEVYWNALEHGFWEGERSIYQTFALIHAEWSEALEEERAGHAMVWTGEHGKPEGIAVELIDGVLRILDFCGKNDYKIAVYEKHGEKKCSLSQLVTELHFNTALVLEWGVRHGEKEREYTESRLSMIVHSVFDWIETEGYKAGEILKMKHAYNKTREYKHGKRY